MKLRAETVKVCTTGSLLCSWWRQLGGGLYSTMGEIIATDYIEREICGILLAILHLDFYVWSFCAFLLNSSTYTNSLWCLHLSSLTSAWCNGEVSMHSRHAMSADTSSTSQQTRQQSGTHLPHHQPRAELSRAVLKPSRAASRGIRFCAAESTCNRIWDWIWAVHQARLVLIKS